MDEQIVNKLKKLLSLSKSATQAEADNALEKATALAAKHNIDLALASINEPIKEEFIEEELKINAKRKCVAQRFITNIITSHFNCEVLYGGSRSSGQKIYFLGRKSDVSFAIYVQEFLKNHMMKSWDDYRKGNNISVRYRASFFDGFWRGLDAKLTEAKRKQEEKSFEEIPEFIRDESRDKYALVIRNEEREREEFVTKKYPKLRSTTSARLNIYGGDANEVGFSSGYSTSINRPLAGQLALC